MIDCMKTYDARNAWNSCLLMLPNDEWTGGSVKGALGLSSSEGNMKRTTGSTIT